MRAGHRRILTNYRESETVCAPNAERHEQSGVTAGETATDPPRLDARAFLKPAGHLICDTCHTGSMPVARTGILGRCNGATAGETALDQ